MSIRNRGIGVIALLSGMVLVAATAEVVERWNISVNAGRAVRMELLVQRELEVAAALTVERGPTNQALRDATPSPNVLRELEESRKSSDAALTALEEAAAEFPIAEKLPSLRQRVQNGRSAASAALARPKDERPADALPNALAALNSAIDAVGDAAVADIALATELSPEAGGLLALARGSWTLRTAAGDVSLPLSGLVASKQPATPKERDRLAAGVDRIDRIWADLMLVGDTPSSAPALRRAFATARSEYFGSGRAVRDHVLKAAYGEAPYDLTLDEWRKSAVAANGSLIAIRDAALEEARQKTHANRDSALFGMQVAVGLIIGVAGLAVWISITFLRTIVRPIIVVSEAMKALAAGQQMTIPYRERHDEIGSMAASIAVFEKAMEDAIALRAEREMAEHIAEQRRREGMRSLADEFEGQVRARRPLPTGPTASSAGWQRSPGRSAPW